MRRQIVWNWLTETRLQQNNSTLFPEYFSKKLSTKFCSCEKIFEKENLSKVDKKTFCIFTHSSRCFLILFIVRRHKRPKSPKSTVQTNQFPILNSHEKLLINLSTKLKLCRIAIMAKFNLFEIYNNIVVTLLWSIYI